MDFLQFGEFSTQQIEHAMDLLFTLQKARADNVQVIDDRVCITKKEQCVRSDQDNDKFSYKYIIESLPCQPTQRTPR